MGAILDALQHLQKIESKLNRFRVKEAAIDRQVRNAERAIDKTDVEYREHLEAVKRCQIEIDQVDLDVRSREESVNKHRQALNAAKSNKEYAAILTALNIEKADVSKCENRVLELLSRKEALEAVAHTFEEQRDRSEKRRQKHEQDLADYREKVHADVDQLLQDREEAAQRLPASALDAYQRVAERLEGDAMAAVVRLSARSEDFVCGGCNMSIPREHVNRLHTRDELLTCSTCGRILFVDTAGVSSR